MSRSVELSPIKRGASLMVAWRLDGKRVLVVGGGEVAAGRVRLSLEADAQVRVVAPQLGAELRARRALIAWEARPYLPSDLDGADMVLVAVDAPALGVKIAAACRARGVPVNVADVPELCDFWFTSVYRDGPLQLAISTAGRAPSLAARLVREIGGRLSQQVGASVSRFGALRDRVRAHDAAPESSGRRMRWLAEIGRTWPYHKLAQLDAAGLDALLDAYASGQPATPPEPDTSPSPEAEEAAPQTRVSGVTLVGAGPGDPGLLTVAGRQAIVDADLVLADRLIAPAILALVTGELRVARKTVGNAGAAQRELEAWAIEGARAGRSVVRLKQGDPLVYGRAGEELEAFREAGVEARIIPGISSVVAAPWAAGVPLTHRGVADRFLVLTGHGADDRAVEVPAADESTTLVWLMAVDRASSIASSMIDRGHAPDLPVAIVERAAQPGQRVLQTDLSHLGETIAREGVKAPAVMVMGRVVDRAVAPPRSDAHAPIHLRPVAALPRAVGAAR